LKESVQYFKRPDIYGLEFIEATFVTHRFARHVHDYYALGVIETGVQTFYARGEQHITPSGGVFLLNPGEPHDGEAAITSGFTYRTFYPTTEMLQKLAEEITGKPQPLPFFSPLIVQDNALTQALLQLHACLKSPGSTLEGEEKLLEVFDLLLTRYADRRVQAQPRGQERQAVRLIRDYLQSCYDQNPSLAELARLVSFSPYYLARVFQAEVGLPPHAYLESVRVRQAQRLLSEGQAISQVAQAVGFADQSHFHHRFKRLIGLTPRQYAQQRKILQ